MEYEWKVALSGRNAVVDLAQIEMDGRSLTDRTTTVQAEFSLADLKTFREAINKAVTVLEMQEDFPLRGSSE